MGLRKGLDIKRRTPRLGINERDELAFSRVLRELCSFIAGRTSA